MSWLQGWLESWKFADTLINPGSPYPNHITSIPGARSLTDFTTTGDGFTPVYLYLVEPDSATVKYTKQVAPGVYIDYDATDRAVGVEILRAMVEYRVDPWPISPPYVSEDT